jgi:hypothetical protein
MPANAVTKYRTRTNCSSGGHGCLRLQELFSDINGFEVGIVLLVGIYRRDQGGEMIGDACKEKASEHFFIERKTGAMEAIAKGRKTVDVGLHGSAAGGFERGRGGTYATCWESPNPCRASQPKPPAAH